MRICPFCNTELENDEVFCHSCGKKEDVSESPTIYAPPEMPTSAVPTAGNSESFSEISNTSEKKSKKWIIVLLSIIGVILIAAGTVAVLHFTGVIDLFGEPSSDNPDKITETVYLPTIIRRYTNGEEVDFYEYSYDENGLLQLLSGESIEHRFTYDENGNMLTRAYYSKGKERSRREYTYDKDGNRLTETIYSNGEEHYERYEYTYDKDGNMLSRSGCCQGIEVPRIECTYDGNGNMLTEITYSEGEEHNRREFTYDGNGNMLTDTFYWEDEEGRHTGRHAEYTYDGNGNILTEISYSEGEEHDRREYTYDKDGNLLTDTEYYKEKTLDRYEYTYDKNGNMLTSTVFSEGEEQIYTEFSYKAFELTPEQAENARKMLEESGFYLTYLKST